MRRLWPSWQPWLRTAAAYAGVLIVFFLAPGEGGEGLPALVTRIAATLIGVGLLGWAIVQEVRAQMQGDRRSTIPSLFTLLGLVVIVFAFGYYALVAAEPDQMAGLDTRVDALYFTLSTLATVGFGDVHAQGQLARGLVLLQMTFDIVFVAALVAVVAGRVREHVNAPADQQGTSDPASGPPERGGP